MSSDIQLQAGQYIEVSVPQWLVREKGLKSRELEGRVLRATPRAVQVLAHVVIRESDTCMFCGREIDNFISRHCGYGPICAENLGLPRPQQLTVEEIERVRERIYRETEVECWLPLSQIVVRTVRSEAASDVDDPAFAPVKATEAAPAEAQPNPRRIVWDDGMYRVLFPYNPDLVLAVKRIGGYRWDNNNKRWSFPATAGADLLRFAAEHGFEVEEAAAQQAEAAREVEEINRVQSRASEAEFHVEGLGRTLRTYQNVGVAYKVRQRRVVNADQMRLGKTVQSLAAIHHENAVPALIVPPAGLKSAWAKEVQKWTPSRSVVVVDGKAPKKPAAPPANADAAARERADREMEAWRQRYAEWHADSVRQIQGVDFVIVNYDILMDCIAPEYATQRRKQVVVGATGPLVSVAWKALVCDEFHKHLLNRKAQRVMVVQYLARTMLERRQEFDPMLLLLSGTPVKRKPSNLIQPLQIIDRLDDLGGFRHYAVHYCGTDPEQGWDLSGATNLDELNERLRSLCYIRRRRADVFNEIPKKQRHSLPVQINNRKEYEAAERGVVQWVAEQATTDKAFHASISGLPAEEREEAVRQRRQEAGKRARRAEQLVRFTALKRLAARGKMDQVVEWVQNFLEETEDTADKILLGAWHQDIVEELGQRLNAPIIHGGTSQERRTQVQDAFQRCDRCGVWHNEHGEDPRSCSEYVPNRACRVVAVNLQSGGMGLTFTAADDAGVVELGWTPDDMDQFEARLEHINKSDPTTIWYFLAENTLDEDLAELIDATRAIVDAATEGEGREESASIMADLMKRLRARQGAGADGYTGA